MGSRPFWASTTPFTGLLPWAGTAGLGVDLTGLQQNDKPTRDVLVVSDESGDREFVGFGSAKNGEFADCFLEASKLPTEAIQVLTP